MTLPELLLKSHIKGYDRNDYRQLLRWSRMKPQDEIVKQILAGDSPNLFFAWFGKEYTEKLSLAGSDPVGWLLKHLVDSPHAKANPDLQARPACTRRPHVGPARRHPSGEHPETDYLPNSNPQRPRLVP